MSFIDSFFLLQHTIDWWEVSSFIDVTTAQKIAKIYDSIGSLWSVKYNSLAKLLLQHNFQKFNIVFKLNDFGKFFKSVPLRVYTKLMGSDDSLTFWRNTFCCANTL